MRTVGLERIAKDEDLGDEEEEEGDAMAGILVTMRTRPPERRMAVPVRMRMRMRRMVGPVLRTMRMMKMRMMAVPVLMRRMKRMRRIALPVSANGKQKPAAL